MKLAWMFLLFYSFYSTNKTNNFPKSDIKFIICRYWCVKLRLPQYLTFMCTMVLNHLHTHTHTGCMKLLGHTVPLGKALSVAMVPFTAFSRSLLLSLAALTLPFSPATLSAFSTQNEHTWSKWAPPFDLMPRQPMKSLAELGMDGIKMDNDK